MLILRWLRIAVVAAVLGYLIGIASVGLLPLVLVNPLSRLLGTLALLGPVAVLVSSSGLTRMTLGRLIGSIDPVPADDHALAAIAAAARSAGLPVPTCWMVPVKIPRPVVLRGARWLFVLATPDQLADPGIIVDALRRDLRSGDAWLFPLFCAVPAALASWRHVLLFSTIGVRARRLAAFDRLRLLGGLIVVPIAATGWCVAWVMVELSRLVTPPRFARQLMVLAGSVDVVTAAPRDDIEALGTSRRISFSTSLSWGIVHAQRTDERFETRRRRRRTIWNTPQAIAGRSTDGQSANLVRAVVWTLLVWFGTYATLGLLVAERVVWPWEQERVSVTVTDVVVDLGGHESILWKLFRIDPASTYTPTIAGPGGAPEHLRAGTVPVRVGQEIDVVPVVASDGRWTTVRATRQTSFAAAMALFVVFALGAMGAQRLMGHESGTLVLGQPRRIAQLDYDQRVATGRRHRRKRPRDTPGSMTYRDHVPANVPQDGGAS